ncbi:MAG TPA: hypothetical protein VFK21_00515 [Gammaproteobacteria bacterium]|nr:hypothetical protein [Gammaproteobacteria bacterium]
MPIGLTEVVDLLDRSVSTRGAILIGGQALNVHAVAFGLAAISTAVSEDIDFFGDASLAREAGRAWGGRTEIATIDDHTANSAYVLIELNGETYQIDFMSQVLGVRAEEMERWAANVEVGNKTIRVMHPLHVVQSQTENVYGQLDRRAFGQRSARRVALAVDVAERQARQYLDGNEIRASLKMAERTARIAIGRPGLRAWHDDSIDLLVAIPQHAKWPDKFIKTRLPQLRKRVDKARAIYARQRERIHR